MNWLFGLLYRLVGWRTIGHAPTELKKGIWLVSPHWYNSDFFVGVGVRAYINLKIGYLGKSALFKWYSGPFLYRGIQDPDFRRDALRFRRSVSERLGALLLGRRAELGHPQPELAIDLGVQAALALMLQDAVYGETRAAGRALGRAALVRELTRSFLAYLGVEGAVAFEPAAR